MFNKDVRQYAKENGVFLYQIADRLNKSEATVTRMMRRELSDDVKTQLRSIILEIAVSHVESSTAASSGN